MPPAPAEVEDYRTCAWGVHVNVACNPAGDLFCLDCGPIATACPFHPHEGEGEAEAERAFKAGATHKRRRR